MKGLQGTYEKLLEQLALMKAQADIDEAWKDFKATGNVFKFVQNMLPPLTRVSAQTSLIDWFLKIGSLSNDGEATSLGNVLKKVPILEEKSWDWKSLIEPFKELVPATFVLGLFDKLGFGMNKGSVECTRAALQKIPSSTDLIKFIDAALTSGTAAGFWNLLKESGLSEVLPESCTAQQLASDLEVTGPWRDALLKALQVPFSDLIECALTGGKAGLERCLEENDLLGGLPDSLTGEIASFLGFKDSAVRDELLKALSSKDRGSAWDNAVAFLSDPDTVLAVGGLIADFLGFENTAREKFDQVVENLPPHCARSSQIKKALPREYRDGGKKGVVCVGHSRGAWLLTAYSHDYNFCDRVVLLGCPGQMKDATKNARVVIDVFNLEDPVIKLRDDVGVKADKKVECRNMGGNHIAEKYAECIRQKQRARDLRQGE